MARRDSLVVYHSIGWYGVHVIVVHIPILALLIAPFLVIVGAALAARKRQFVLGAALALMVMGTSMSFVAIATGEAALKAVGPTPAIKLVVEKHRLLAETTTELFSVLTVGFAALLLLTGRLGRELESRTGTALLAVYLILYTSGALFLVHTALQGGQVAHAIESKTSAAYHLPGGESAR